MSESTVIYRGTVSSVSSPAAETAILTTPTLYAGGVPAGAAVRISGSLDVTEGTGGTAFVIRLRQGSVSGPIVGQALTQTIAAAASESAGYSFEDATGYLEQPGGGVYVLTVAETSATVAGTVVQAEMQVEQ